MNRQIFSSILCIAGPQKEYSSIRGQLEKTFDKVLFFDVPDDYGEFPDTTGYTSENFEQLESTMEDPALYPYMTKCVDAVMEHNRSRAGTLVMLGYKDVEDFIHSPKFGGKLYVVAGIVKAFPPAYIGANN